MPTGPSQRLDEAPGVPLSSEGIAWWGELTRLGTDADMACGLPTLESDATLLSPEQKREISLPWILEGLPFEFCGYK